MPLSFGRCLSNVMLHISLMLLFVGMGLHEIASKNYLSAAVAAIMALTQFPLLALWWKRLRIINNGGAITLNPVPSLRIWKPFSVILLFILTLIVAVTSLFSYFLVTVAFHSIVVSLIVLAINLWLWLFTGSCWYRIVTERQGTKSVEPVSDSIEGVWPPPPQIPASNDMEQRMP